MAIATYTMWKRIKGFHPSLKKNNQVRKTLLSKSLVKSHGTSRMLHAKVPMSHAGWIPMKANILPNTRSPYEKNPAHHELQRLYIDAATGQGLHSNSGMRPQYAGTLGRRYW